jgi:hypothetical protein
MRTPLLVSAALAAAGGLVAQGVVIPSASATKDPNYYDYYCTYGVTSTVTKNEGHGLYLYDSADVGSATVWKSVSWRRPHSISNTNNATTFSMTIIMSNSPVAYNSPSSTFSSNHGNSTSGTPPQTVLNNQISLPANSRGSTWPEPWFAAIPISIFVHAPVKGGSLVIECMGSNNSQNRTYYCEGHQVDNGQRLSNGPSGGCLYHSESGSNNVIGLTYPKVGGTWYVSHSNMPSNEPNMKKSLNIIGLQGVGGKAFGMTLAIPIASLGFLDVCQSRPGVLANDLVIVQPMAYTTSTAGPSRGAVRTPTVNIPNDPRLGGLAFFAQPFCPDKPVNGRDQIFMAWPSKWVIGSGTGPKGSVVYQTGNNASPIGTVRIGYSRTMLLQ